MTSNQIAYMQAMETQRANAVNEARNQRLAEADIASRNAEVVYKEAATAKTLAEERDRRLQTAIDVYKTTGDTEPLGDVLSDLGVSNNLKLAILEGLSNAYLVRDTVSDFNPITTVLDTWGIGDLAEAIGDGLKAVKSFFGGGKK